MKIHFHICFIFFLVISLFGRVNAQLKEVSASEFSKQLEIQSVQLLDVRTAEEYENGHIPEALQANWNNQQEFSERIVALDKDKPVYIYCLAGSRSAAAQKYLLEKGFKQVVNLKGGINAWEGMNLPIEGKKEVSQISLETFLNSLPQDQLTLVDFGATWCPPCIKMNPIVDELITEGYPLVKIDGGNQKELVKAFEISSFPTFILMKNGKEISRLNGIQEKETLIKLLDSK